MAKHKFDYDVIVIGGGISGLAAAKTLSDSRLKIAIVEQNETGSSAELSLRALMTSAHALDEARRASAFGLRVNTLGYNYPSINNWRELVAKRAKKELTPEKLQKLGVDAFRGRAHFLSPNEISIARRHLTAEKFVICTGSELSTPNIIGLNEIDYLTPESISNLSRLPKSLFIVGAGRTGVQLAEFFSVFGVKVYLADTKKRILAREDDEISELLANVLSKIRGVEILNSTRVVSVENESPLVRVNYLNGEDEKSVKVDRVLIATGRKPAIDLGLENAGIEFDAEGIKVNDFLAASRNIFAAGDVLGRYADTAVSAQESRTVAMNMTSKSKATLNYHAASRVIWTTPEVATAGATEAELIRQDVTFKSTIIQNSAVQRSNVTNFSVGFTKIITDEKGRLLAANVVGPNSAETINVATLAISAGLTVDDIAAAMPAFGSWAEALHLAASKTR